MFNLKPILHSVQPSLCYMSLCYFLRWPCTFVFNHRDWLHKLRWWIISSWFCHNLLKNCRIVQNILTFKIIEITSYYSIQAIIVFLAHALKIHVQYDQAKGLFYTPWFSVQWTLHPSKSWEQGLYFGAIFQNILVSLWQNIKYLFSHLLKLKICQICILIMA